MYIVFSFRLILARPAEILATTVRPAWLFNKVVTSATVYQDGRVRAARSTPTTALNSPAYSVPIVPT